MANELTTLQVARRIADAVIETVAEPPDYRQRREEADATDPPTQAVLRVLHETGSWLSRWDSELPPEPVAPSKDDEPTLF